MALFQEVKEKVLFLIWNEAYDSNSAGHYHITSAQRFSPQDTSSLIARKAIQALIEEGLLERSEGWPEHFEISARGIEYVEAQLESSWTVIGQYAEEEAQAPLRASAPEQADTWQPLKIDRQQPEYQEVVNSVEAALEAIRGDNGYATSQADEREQIVTAIQTGLDRIKHAFPTRAEIKALLLDPLKFVARKFAEMTIGELAKVAATAIIKWLF
ncbi:hypothetical protein [Hypericibacter adhaerens]|nr:hypothetical protein [Hypericibacter adhaerens]